MARWSAARWNPVTTCGDGNGNVSPITPTAVTLHHQVGYGDPAGVYEARSVSAHFWIARSGEAVQHVDTNNRAWHGGTDAHNTNGIGVETEGCATSPNADPLTDNQLTMFAELMAWANRTHGIPLVLSEDATVPGLNYHRCINGYATACPCQIRVDARAEILRRAGGLGQTLPPLEAAALGGAQEDTTVAICPHPDGRRIDMVVVGANRSVYHYWAADGELRNPKLPSENLGGRAKAVSACWVGDRFTVVCHGADNDRAYERHHQGGRWSAWAIMPDPPVGALYPD